MKAQVSRQDNQLRILVILVVISLLLLVFGIYQVISHSKVINAYSYYENVPMMNVYTNQRQSINEIVSPHLILNNHETPLKIESWMLDTDKWNLEEESFSSEMLFEEEPDLEIEEWMLSDEGWLM